MVRDEARVHVVPEAKTNQFAACWSKKQQISLLLVLQIKKKERPQQCDLPTPFPGGPIKSILHAGET